MRPNGKNRLAAIGAPVVAVALAVVVSGCALNLRPPATTAARPATTAGPPTARHNEIPTAPGPVEQAPGHATPDAALRSFALGYINWDGADVRSRLQALARASVGQARTAMELAASQTGSDVELTQAGIANHGSVAAIAPLTGASRYVVVTRESTTATESTAYQGLAPAWHLTLATVVHRPGGWVVNSWQPEN